MSKYQLLTFKVLKFVLDVVFAKMKNSIERIPCS